MRTTVTLDPDVDSLLKNVMRERGISFKAALNETIRSTLKSTAGATAQQEAQRTPTFHMGFNASASWDQALQLAGELEDDELIRRLAVRK